LGLLNVAPNFTAEQVTFDFDEQGHHIGIGTGQTLTGTSAAVWRTGVSSNATFYGTFRPRLGSLVGLRHIVTPSASFAFSPATTAGDRFHDFGGSACRGASRRTCASASTSACMPRRGT